MSQSVRTEVSPKSHEWGYQLGSVYIRKVHFRDANMIKQIEEKVVNRLRQVTSAIKQDGANQVSIITSTAERNAAAEFAKAATIRPKVIGEALTSVSADQDVCDALFEILEAQKIIEGNGGKLSVTRITDLTQEPNEGPAEDSSAPSDDPDPAELDHDQDQTSGDSKSPGGQGDVDTPSASDAFNTYVRCENVKP
jgi:hypothetical protein